MTLSCIKTHLHRSFHLRGGRVIRDIQKALIRTERKNPSRPLSSPTVTMATLPGHLPNMVAFAFKKARQRSAVYVCVSGKWVGMGECYLPHKNSLAQVWGEKRAVSI